MSDSGIQAASYAQTGVPWPTSRLGKHVKIYSGVAPSQISLASDGKYPFVKVEDLNNCAKYQETSRLFTNEKKGFAPANSVIFPKRGAAIMNNKIRIAAVDVTMDTNLMAVMPVDGLDTEYFFYAIEKEGLFKIADTSTIPQLNNKHINPYELPIPPLSEQRKIAEILQTWDAALEKLDFIHAAKLKRFDGAAQRLLAPTRAIGRNVIRSNWALTTFGEVFAERRDRNRVLQAADVVTVGKYAIRKQSEHFRRSVASKDLSNYWVISPGDFVYDPMSVYYGAMGRYNGASDGLVSPAYRVIQLSEEVIADFAVHLLRTYHIRFLLEMRSSQGNKEGKRRLLQRDEFESIEFFLPQKDEQERIAAILLDFETDLTGQKS